MLQQVQRARLAHPTALGQALGQVLAPVLVPALAETVTSEVPVRPPPKWRALYRLATL